MSDLDSDERAAWLDPNAVLNPNLLDSLLRADGVSQDSLIGRLCETWITEPGKGYPIMRLTDGQIAIRVDGYSCLCGSETTTLYLVSGLHFGAFAYNCDEHGNYLANMRDQEFYCGDECLQRWRKQRDSSG